MVGSVLILLGGCRGSSFFAGESMVWSDGATATAVQVISNFCVRCRIQSQSRLVQRQVNGDSSMTVAAPGAKVLKQYLHVRTEANSESRRHRNPSVLNFRLVDTPYDETRTGPMMITHERLRRLNGAASTF